MGKASLSEMFVQFLDEHGLRRRSVSNPQVDFRVFYVDLSPLRLRFSDRTPMIEIPAETVMTRSPKEVLASLTDVILRLQFQRRIPIALVEGRSDSLRKAIQQSPYRVAMLDEEDMAEIADSGLPSDAILIRIRDQIPLAFLSPYEVSAPVTGGQFFGRDYEVRTILHHPQTCYSVIGSRRIGKTSVLKEVQRRLLLSEACADRFLYYDCMSFDCKEDFFERTISDLFPKEYRRLWRTGESYAAHFVQFVKRMKSVHQGPIIFFLDELDHMLEFDRKQGYELIGILRACFQEGSCRIIFSGFREALRELRETDSPLNFSTPLILSNFSESQAAELVQVPMNNLGVEFDSQDQVVRRIYRETAGHPNVIQHYCLSVLRQLDESGIRTIAPENLARLADDESFRARVLETFVYNTNDLEKAVAYAVADLDLFSIEDVDLQMKRHRILLEIRDLEDACRKLESLGLVTQQHQNYQFVIPVFPQLLRERYGGDFLFSKAKEHVKRRMR